MANPGVRQFVGGANVAESVAAAAFLACQFSSADVTGKT